MSKKCCNPGIVNPYSRADFERLKNAQRTLSDLIPLMDKIERCGVECDTFRAVAQELQTRLGAIEREFMSPVPNR